MEHDPSPQRIMANVIGRAVPCVFGFIGLTICVFLWFAPFGEFGSPPLFFRVFGTLITCVFMLMGFGTAIFGPGALAAARTGGLLARIKHRRQGWSRAPGRTW